MHVAEECGMRQQSATLTHHTTHNQLMASAFPCSPNEPTQSLRKCPRFRSEKAHAVKHERNCSCCVAMSDRHSVRKRGILAISAIVRLICLILGDSRLQIP